MRRILYALAMASAVTLAGTGVAVAGHGGGGDGGGGFHSGGVGAHYGGAHYGGAHYGGSYGGINHGYSGYGGYGGYRYGGVPYSGRGYGYGGYGYGGYGGLGGYGYGGLGYGGLGGFGSLWYSNYGYPNSGYSSRNYGGNSFFAPAYSTLNGATVAPQMPPPPQGEYGLKITEVLDGAAKKADLRPGDVILGVGPTRTQSFEELQAALAASNNPVDIVFINGESKKVEKLSVTPTNGKIGVAVIPVEAQ